MSSDIFFEFQKRWRFIDTGCSGAAYNMAVDEAIFRNFKEGDLPVIRLYSWEPSLTLGRFSNLGESIDLDMLEKQNLSYARRMTGGGVLVHGGDLSYSLTLPREGLKNIGVKESYRYLCAFLIEFYRRLGLDAQFAHDAKLSIAKSNICMASNEPYDIVIEGKKMGGNAQRYSSAVVFQHGSIPIRLDEVLFKDIFLQESGLKNGQSLDKIGKSVTQEQLVGMVVEAFSDTFGAELLFDTLTPLELQSARELLQHKYTQKEYNADAKQNHS